MMQQLLRFILPVLSAVLMLALGSLSAKAVVLKNKKTPPRYDLHHPPVIISQYARTPKLSAPVPDNIDEQARLLFRNDDFFTLSRTRDNDMVSIFNRQAIAPESSRAAPDFLSDHLLPQITKNGEILEQSFNAFLDTLNESSALKTVYFNSLQLQFSFRSNIVNALGVLDPEAADFDPLAYIDNSDSLGLQSSTLTEKARAPAYAPSLIQQLMDNIKSIGSMLLSLVIICYLLIHYVINRYI